jgi:glycosyltransferase involved in cell wall biosynthesis
VQNGINVERFQRDAAAADIWRQRWGIPPTTLVLGAVGRLNKVKGYGTALLGFQALLKRFPEKDLRLVLVGEGAHEQALREFANRILPPNRVIFSPFCDRPWEPLSALDIFLMPSLNEGFGLALAEAMACECCPVAMAVGGVPDMISSSDFGWIIPPGDSDAFTAAMIDATLRTPEQRTLMGKRAREHIVANFNGTVQYNHLVDVMESLVPASHLPWAEVTNVARRH